MFTCIKGSIIQSMLIRLGFILADFSDLIWPCLTESRLIRSDQRFIWYVNFLLYLYIISYHCAARKAVNRTWSFGIGPKNWCNMSTSKRGIVTRKNSWIKVQFYCTSELSLWRICPVNIRVITDVRSKYYISSDLYWIIFFF